MAEPKSSAPGGIPETPSTEDSAGIHNIGSIVNGPQAAGHGAMANQSVTHRHVNAAESETAGEAVGTSPNGVHRRGAGPAGPRDAPWEPGTNRSSRGEHAERVAEPVSRSVFVVHGRDEQVRREMFELLRRLDLRPLEWEDLVGAVGGGSPFLGEVAAQAPSHAQAALVLLTPDDIVRLHPKLHHLREPQYETHPSGQPRPNVLLELGMVLMAYPERTVIIEIGDLRHIADLAGRNVIRFDGSPIAIGKIVERLKSAGCRVNDRGADWRDTRPFADLDAYERRPE